MKKLFLSCTVLSTILAFASVTTYANEKLMSEDTRIVDAINLGKCQITLEKDLLLGPYQYSQYEDGKCVASSNRPRMNPVHLVFDSNVSSNIFNHYSIFEKRVFIPTAAKYSKTIERIEIIIEKMTQILFSIEFGWTHISIVLTTIWTPLRLSIVLDMV